MQIPEGDAWELLRGMQGVLAAVAEAVEVAASELDDNGSSSDSGDEDTAGGMKMVAGCSGVQQVADIAEALRELHADFSAKFREYNTQRLMGGR